MVKDLVKQLSDPERGNAFRVENEYSFTTGQFTKSGRVYKRHCGPTAVTNLVFALAGKEGRPIAERPEDVFRRVAGIGQKSLVYINADFLKRFGGTSDLLAPFMIRSCLRAYGLDGYEVRGPYPATARRICRELGRGAILYMEVHGHPVYGAHHMLCYGCSVRDGRLYLRTADGWTGRIRNLQAGEELFALCTVISKKAKK